MKQPITRRPFLLSVLFISVWLPLQAQNLEPLQSVDREALQVSRTRTMPETVAPVGPTSLHENEQLKELLEQYGTTPDIAALQALEDWVEANPGSKWNPSVLYNLGLSFYADGHFTRALKAWQKGWEQSKHLEDLTGKTVADANLGELAFLYARLVMAPELEALLKNVEGRDTSSPGYDKLRMARDMLREMQEHPEEMFVCGSNALINVRHVLGIPNAAHEVLTAALGTTEGMSLLTVANLAKQADMDWVPVQMTESGKYPIPSVIHWKTNHFAALVKKENDRYLVKDPTYGDLWVTDAAMKEEASGYYLVPASVVGHRILKIGDETAATIWGKCHQGLPPAGANDGCDDQAGGEKGECKPCKSKCEKGDSNKAGMARYSFHLLLASLKIQDFPVGYEPPVGPPVKFIVTYGQRDVSHPSIIDYSNLGKRWGYNWHSRIQYTTSNPSDVVLYSKGGGQRAYSGLDTTTGEFAPPRFGNVRLVRTSTSPLRFEARFDDGSIDVYEQVHMAGTVTRVLLSRLIDPQGNAVSLQYDSISRLTGIVDALGRTTTICYDLDPSGNCLSHESNLLIRKVTDPFGRAATFHYDGSARLIKIVDTVGMASEFQYGAGEFITTMTTPYGATRFETEDGTYFSYNDHRWIQATDPSGETERAEFMQDTNDHGKVFPSVLSASEVPDSILFYNSSLNTNNAFYWGKKAMREAPGDLFSAHVTNYFYVNGHTTSRIKRAEKPVGAGWIVFEYPGQSGLTEGTSSQPIKIARKLDDGSTELVQYQYNSQGNLTRHTDPVGREKTYTFAANGIDVIRVNQKTDTTSVTLMEVTYANHLPILVKDASGQETVVTYNPFGQLESVTNAQNQTLSYDYSTTGLLERVISTNSESFVDLSYDSLDRITSATAFPQNYTIGKEYDLMDRETRIIYPDGTSEESVYERLDVARTKDRMGQWTQYLYGNLPGRPHAVTNPAGEIIQYDWCNCGALSRLVDAEGRITVFDYDIAGRLVRKELPDGATELYEYETMAGRKKSVIDSKGQKKNLTYNTDGTISSISWSDVAPGTLSVAPVSFTYDSSFKRLTSYTDGIGTTQIAYHPYSWTNEAWGDGLIASVDGPWANDTIAYAYDELGRMVERKINDSANPSTVAYDSEGRLQSSSNPLGIFTFEYEDATDQLTRISSNLGHIKDLTYKGVLEDLRLDGIENLATTTSLLSKFTYGYDQLSRITEWGQQQDPKASGPTPYKMKYDRSGRLTQALRNASQDSGTRWNYRYDKAGNRLNDQVEQFSLASTDVERQTFTINIADQVTSSVSGGPVHVTGVVNEQARVAIVGDVAEALTEADGSFSAWVDGSQGDAGTVLSRDWSGNTTTTLALFSPAEVEERKTLLYDANGNLVQTVVQLVDGVTTFSINYEWDALNRITAIDSPGQFRSEFGYDGFGRRVSIMEKDATGVVTRQRYFLWEGLSIVEERATTGGSPTKQFFVQGEMHGSTAYYYTRDHLGSLREVTDASGNIIARYEYDPYGKVTQTAGTIEFDFLYTGHLYHYPSGLYLAPYRMYDSHQGRWCSREPLGLDGPNLYHYTFNDPISNWDPSGLKTHRIILFPPEEAGMAPDGVRIDNKEDLEWYLNNRVKPCDTIEFYGHGDSGSITIGPDGGPAIYPDELDIDTGCRGASFYSCSFAKDKPQTPWDDFDTCAKEWSDLFKGADIDGYRGPVRYYHSRIFGKWIRGYGGRKHYKGKKR